MIQQDNPPAATASGTGSLGGGPAPARLVSLDAFRGAIMLLMASSGLGIPQLAARDPESPFWRWLGYQFSHAEWVGCSLWDLIQPAFMFMVGVALPWSVANRRARGESTPTMVWHAVRRSLLLVFLAVFLTSAWSPRTDWVFTNVLAQIGLGYPVLFLFSLARQRVQWIGFWAILLGYWGLFALYPMPGAEFRWEAVGIKPEWVRLEGFAGHWEKNANAAAAFDLWFLNLFPRETPFQFNAGGYHTLNFVPSIATMLLGLLAGQWLRRPMPVGAKVKGLVIWGVAGLFLGAVVAGVGLCPIVKRIWTPSWVLFSGGWVALLLAAFVGTVDGLKQSRWSFPLVVAGTNPITLYCMWQLMGGSVRANLKTHLGQGIFASFGPAYEPVLERGCTLLVFWLILWWLHRRRIFIRI